MQDSIHSIALPTRLVLFMTHERPADVPGDAQRLACLLPLGTASFAERTMDTCALAGVRQLDVVVSQHPEALRHILQDGAPWGIQINWHHAKASATPYKVLRGMALDPAQRIVIGHAHQWVSSRIVRELMQANGTALYEARKMAWAGWFSTDAAALCALGPGTDYESLQSHLRTMAGARCVLTQPAEHGQCQCAFDLLAAQHHALLGTQEAAVPASWRRMSWGAASPDAVIHADAQIRGPVLIGPGSVVEAGAQLEPGTVLARDVFVARGARVSNALVMSNTYVGGQITLNNALAQGNHIQSLKWSLRTVLSPLDAMMAPLRSDKKSTTPWTSRASAALVAAALVPLLMPALVQWRLTGRGPWRQLAVVQSRRPGQESLERVKVRLAHSHRTTDRWAAHWGALLDIVQGRRCWFGLRPRRDDEWQALGRDWQELFSRTAIGLFHAPAWTEGSDNSGSEACAAADAFMAVQSTLAVRVKILIHRAQRRKAAGAHSGMAAVATRSLT
jgi:hypothetical protein